MMHVHSLTGAAEPVTVLVGRSIHASCLPPPYAGGKTLTRASKLAAMTTREDCCVKLLRLIANLAIHPKVGVAWYADQHIAVVLTPPIRHHSIHCTDELAVIITV
jgi:hypothetical protein